ncbi:protein PROCA1 [Rhineura floridana]|uniref:protein PROCA1 n=1 Tax=Rhineura floridana TaxID=261503 RepID=UPI002AC85A8B|nr:protein PROCA1 [Rhineura floridana]
MLRKGASLDRFLQSTGQVGVTSLTPGGGHSFATKSSVPRPERRNPKGGCVLRALHDHPILVATATGLSPPSWEPVMNPGRGGLVRVQEQGRARLQLDETQGGPSSPVPAAANGMPQRVAPKQVLETGLEVAAQLSREEALQPRPCKKILALSASQSFGARRGREGGGREHSGPSSPRGSGHHTAGLKRRRGRRALSLPHGAESGQQQQSLPVPSVNRSAKRMPWRAAAALLCPALLLLLAAASGAGLARDSPAPCVLRSPLSDGRLRFQASDGRELLSATWAPRGAGLSGCRVSVEAREVAAFLSRCPAVQRREEEEEGEPAFPGLAEAKGACLDGSGSVSPRRRTKRGFTYPGTLWCGAGNIAASYEELGAHRETDRCCREHDHCHHVIHPFTYKYGYRNFRWHTISHCDCDNRLKACLRAVNDTASRVVGQAFFNVIQVPCFKFAYKEQCVEPYLYVWCKNYTTVVVAVAQEPVLYEFGGELIDGLATRQPPAWPSSTTAPPHSCSSPPTNSASLPRKPEQAVTVAVTTPAPQARPSSLPKKHRKGKKGKGKGKRRKGKKGKGLKKAEAKAKTPAVLHPHREDAAISRKQLAMHEPAKVDFQAQAELPDIEEDPFNAILSDDPAGGADLSADASQAVSKEAAAPPKANSKPSSVQKKRKGRRSRLQKKEGQVHSVPSSDLGGRGQSFAVQGM